MAEHGERDKKSKKSRLSGLWMSLVRLCRNDGQEQLDVKSCWQTLWTCILEFVRPPSHPPLNLVACGPRFEWACFLLSLYVVLYSPACGWQVSQLGRQACMCKDSIIHVRSEAACSSNVSVAPVVSLVIPINPLPQWMWLCSITCGCTQNKNCNWFMPQCTVDTGPQLLNCQTQSYLHWLVVSTLRQKSSSSGNLVLAGILAFMLSKHAL